MKKLTLDEARERIKAHELWIWRQEHCGPNSDREKDYTDEDYPGPGLESMFWDIPNM